MHAASAGAALLHVLPRSRWSHHLLFRQCLKGAEAQVSLCHPRLMQSSEFHISLGKTVCGIARHTHFQVMQFGILCLHSQQQLQYVL